LLLLLREHRTLLEQLLAVQGQAGLLHEHNWHAGLFEPWRACKTATHAAGL
jgi:hypothetical protein